MSAPFAPAATVTDRAERLVTLDILRGFALLGMIVVHFHQKMRLEAGGLADVPAWFVYVFVEQKSWGTFAFLFGVGFAVLLRRLDARRAPVVPIYLRRLAVLAVFGVIAEVGFGFTILFTYACWGLVLLVVRRWPPSWLLAGAVAAAMARPVVAGVAALAGHPIEPVVASVAVGALRAAVEAASGAPDYLALLLARWNLFAGAMPRSWYDLLPDSNLALFLAGCAALRAGVFDNPAGHARLIRRAMAFGIVSWGAAWIVLPHVPVPATAAMAWPIVAGLGLLQDQWLCFTYIGAVLLLVARQPAWTHRLESVGLAGRMALTNYLLQCAVLDALASGYGLRLRVAPLTGLLAGTLLFVAFAAFSRAWLTRFQYGPLEWVWRAATYLTVPTAARSAPAAQG